MFRVNSWWLCRTKTSQKELSHKSFVHFPPSSNLLVQVKVQGLTGKYTRMQTKAVGGLVMVRWMSINAFQ